MQRKTWYSILGLNAMPLSLKNLLRRNLRRKLGQESRITSTASLFISGALNIISVSNFCRWQHHSSKFSLLKPGISKILIDLRKGACEMMSPKQDFGKEQVISKCLRLGNKILFVSRSCLALVDMLRKGHSFCMINETKFGQFTATSIISKPPHCIFSPLSCLPINSRHAATSSTIMFSRVR